MEAIYLHRHNDFEQLLRIVEEQQGILAALVEKDYWLMQVLYGLKAQGFSFELKGGTSLSKGYKIISRFSEDIDVLIHPALDANVAVNPRKIKDSHVQSRKRYYDWLSENIRIDGIVKVERDEEFDDVVHYRSGGIRLYYDAMFPDIAGVKPGILLEVGFDDTEPNTRLPITSWAYDFAANSNASQIIDNRALDIPCYHPGYTFVEKLQTIAKKFRQEQEDGKERANLLRQYYDIAQLLSIEEVRAFIGTEAYLAHKKKRFPKIDLEMPLNEHPAFQLNDPAVFNSLERRYIRTKNLYYRGQPAFRSLTEKIIEYLELL